MSATDGRVAVVTGASRGAGKGIALALAETGMTVYVTGRTRKEGHSVDGLPGTIYRTAEDIAARGGTGIPVACDHGDEAEVRALFERIGHEHGRLDILVNNATALSAPPETPGQPFWQRSLAEELKPLDVGLRSHFVAAYFAAPLLIHSGGLVVHTSSPGARTYLPGVHGPVYGAGKAGSDKLAHDMAQEFRPHGVAVVSIWMGVLDSEQLQRGELGADRMIGTLFPGVESPELTGRIIKALADDPAVMARTGHTYWGSELASEYGVTDLDGSVPPSYREWLGAPSEFPAVAPTYAAFLEQRASRAQEAHTKVVTRNSPKQSGEPEDTGADRIPLGDHDRIEAIKRLKYRYWRACDAKDPAGIRACFVETGADIDFGPLGRFDADGLAQVFRDIALSTHEGGHRILDMHHGMMPDIALLTATEAVGSWTLRFTQLDLRARTQTLAAIEYDDRYVLENGEWRMSTCHSRTLWSITQPLSAEAAITDNIG
ncbi:SDR family NAD(P)-dependent oxidoreductase [Nocardia grenadensis]|uniref:SDR family NAD(P)-dependent oxidoreductase n=1 Tax=Nocardia grenadensis TaxID=931537 RepID=UPI003D75D2D8